MGVVGNRPFPCVVTFELETYMMKNPSSEYLGAVSLGKENVKCKAFKLVIDSVYAKAWNKAGVGGEYTVLCGSTEEPSVHIKQGQ